MVLSVAALILPQRSITHTMTYSHKLYNKYTIYNETRPDISPQATTLGHDGSSPTNENLSSCLMSFQT